MADKVKGIPEAVVHYTFKRHDDVPGEQRQAIDALKMWQAIAPFMGGEWTILEARVDDTEHTFKRTRNVRVARVSDGAEIEIWPSWSSHESTVRVSAAQFHYTADRKFGDTISNHWLYGQSGSPSATIDISKRNAKAIAGDILRRVVEPVAAIMPKVRECQAQRATTDKATADAVSEAMKVPGVTVREHYNNKGTKVVHIAGTHGGGEIRQGSADLYVERLYLPIAGLAEFAALLRKYAPKKG